MPVGIPQFEMNGYDYNSARSYYYPNYDNLYARDDGYRRDLEPYRRDDPYRSEDRLESPRREDPYSNFNPHPVEEYKQYNTRQAGGSEYPSYEVDHLATFSASQSEALKPDVGLSKLASMANTSGIWTMKCILIIERDSLVIHEKGTGDQLERFFFGALRNPVAISKPDKREVYNNLVLLTVVDGNGSRDAQAHMHIFLAGSEPAQDIVNEIISAKDGRPTHINARIPPPPNQPAPEPPIYVRDKVNSFERNMREGDRPQEPIGFPPVRDQDMESVLSEKTEKDVQLLNHCFDDIEKFVSRLQKAAESYKELERLKKEKGNKGKKRQDLEDKLELTSQPPKPHDYIDIFQKFKLSFNLLAKLKAHIHDPNAPELVHFLFTPLSLIYEASRDPSHGNRELASNVVSPLLTKEAKELLLNCLTSKETDLWMSLGEAWYTSRDKWKHFVQPYTPRFYNGWHPAPFLDEMSGAQPPASRTYISTPIRNYEEPIAPPNPEPRQPMERAMPQEINRYNNPQPMPPEDSNEYFLEELKKKGAKICCVSHSREKKHSKELTVTKGEYLEVLDDSRNWWKLKNSKGSLGHAPFTILNKVNTNGYDDGVSPYADSAGVANRKGQRGRIVNNEGHLADQLMTIQANNPDELYATIPAKRSDETPPKEPPNVDQGKVEAIGLTKSSTETQVAEWLIRKGFSPRIRGLLFRYNGEALLNLKSMELENMLGQENGHRLATLLALKKHPHGYESKCANELRTILERRRAMSKTDEEKEVESGNDITNLPQQFLSSTEWLLKSEPPITY